MPRVSVIVPVFNGAETIERAIGSLVGQTLNDLEVVIVNDGSTDATRRLIDDLASQHANLLTVHNRHNLGPYEARLAGLRVATAPWIGFLDSDDIARPEMFETMLSAGERESADIVVCGVLRVSAAGRVIGSKLKFRSSTTVRRDIFNRFCSLRFGTGTLWNKLYRRQLIARHGSASLPWRQDTNEDLLLNIGCFKEAQSVHVLRNILYEYVHHDRSLTSQIARQDAIVETLRAFAVAIELFSESGDNVLSAITNLYRRQFNLAYLRLDYSASISNRADSVREAVDLICQSYPTGLAELISPAPRERLSIGYLSREVANRLLGLAP